MNVREEIKTSVVVELKLKERNVVKKSKVEVGRN